MLANTWIFLFLGSQTCRLYLWYPILTWKTHNKYSPGSRRRLSSRRVCTHWRDKNSFIHLHFELLTCFIIIISIMIIVFFFFRQGKIFIGVSCDTNDAKVAKLLSTISAGKRTYNCSCDGTITIGVATMYCYVQYWERQL